MTLQQVTERTAPKSATTRLKDSMAQLNRNVGSRVHRSSSINGRSNRHSCSSALRVASSRLKQLREEGEVLSSSRRRSVFGALRTTRKATDNDSEDDTTNDTSHGSSNSGACDLEDTWSNSSRCSKASLAMSCGSGSRRSSRAGLDEEPQTAVLGFSSGRFGPMGPRLGEDEPQCLTHITSI